MTYKRWIITMCLMVLILIISSSNVVANPTGLIIVEDAIVRTDPNVNAEIIQRLAFGTPITAYIDWQFELQGWYEIYLGEDQTGWISDQDAYVYPLAECYRNEEGDAWLYFHTARNLIWSGVDKEQVAEKFLLRLLDYPDQQVLFIDEAEGNDYYQSLHVAVLDCLAYAQKDPEKGVKYLEKIAEEETARLEDKARAKYDSINFYKKFDLEKMVEAIHQLIVTYADFLIFGFEWNIWLDVEAAYELMNLFYEEQPDSEKLLQESQRIMDETTNGAVYHIGAAGKAVSLVHMGKTEQAFETVVEAIGRYPMEVRKYYLYDENYVLYSLGYALKAFEKQGKYLEGAEFADKVRESVHNLAVNSYAELRIAQLLDFGPGGRDQVLDLYSLVSQGKIEMLYGLDWNSRLERIKKIQKFKVTEGVINSPKAYIRSGVHSQESEQLEVGTKVKLLYQLEQEKKDGVIGALTKVQLPDGKIGWVFGGYISKSKPLNIFAPLQENDEYWKMPGADIYNDHQLAVPGIVSPGIIGAFPEIRGEVVFSDINSDQILDFLGYNTSLGLVAVDGKAGNYLWSYQVLWNSMPIIQEGRVYITGSHEIGKNTYEQRLSVLDLASGEAIYEMKIADGESDKNVPPIIMGEEAYVGTDSGVMKVNYKNKKIYWEFPLSMLTSDRIVKSGGYLYFSGKKEFEKSRKLYAVRANSGSLLWESERGNGYQTSLMVYGDLVYFNNKDGAYYFLDANQGFLRIFQHKVQLKELDNAKWSEPIFGSDNMLYITYGPTLYAIDYRKGDVKWSYELENPYLFSRDDFIGRPALVNDQLYVVTENYSLLALSPDDGSKRWEIQLVKDPDIKALYPPTVAQGRVFVSANDTLYVIGEYDSSFDSVLNANLVTGFHDGLAVVQENDQFGYINEKGQIIIPPQYYGASQMKDGRALVLSQADDVGADNLGSFAYIDQEGKVVENYLATVKSSYNFSKTTQLGERLIVVCRSGLSLREGPGANTKRLAVVRPGQEVVLVEDSLLQVPYEYDGLKGYWAYVDYKGQKGYIFSGYLGKLPNPWTGWAGYNYESTDSFSWYFSHSIGQVDRGTKVWLSNQYFVELTQLRLGIIRERYGVRGSDQTGDQETIQMEVYHIPNVNLEDVYLVTKLLYEELDLKSFDEEEAIDCITFDLERNSKRSMVTIQKVDGYVKIWVTTI